MIQPAPAQRNTIGEGQNGLQHLTTTLAALTTGQRAQETRDAALQAQLTTQAASVAHVGQWLRWQCAALAALGVLVLLLSGVVGWEVWHPPSQGYARALGVLDQAIGQQWGSLPKSVQEQLVAAYARIGMQSPGERFSPKK